MNLRVVHRPDAGHERGERADDGDEAGEDDRLAAVLLVEAVRAVEIFLLQEADLAAEGPRPDVGPDPVVDRVAEDGGDASAARRATRTFERARCAANVPAANSSESPGRKGVTTRPVSQKMITNRIR